MICALASAICYGTASVLQAVAARAAEPGTGSGLDPALLSRVLRQWRCLAGLALDGIGFLFQIVALRSIPLYGWARRSPPASRSPPWPRGRRLGIRLSRTRWGAVAAVCAGLTMIGLASGPDGNRAAPAALGRLLPAAVVVVLLSGALLGRLPAGPRALLRSCTRRGGGARAGSWGGPLRRPGRELGAGSRARGLGPARHGSASTGATDLFPARIAHLRCGRSDGPAHDLSAVVY